MGFNELYIHQSDSYVSENFLEFFGFRLECEQNTTLHSTYGGSTYLQRQDNGDYQIKSSPISSYYTESASGYHCTLTRRDASEEQKELEQQFIDAMLKKGIDPRSDDYIWKAPVIPTSVSKFYSQNVKDSIIPKIVVGLVWSICAAAVFYAIYLHSQAGQLTPQIHAYFWSALGGAFLVAPVLYFFTSWLFDPPAFQKRSEDVQEKYRDMYFENIRGHFPKEAAEILKKYAIMKGYDTVGRYPFSRNKSRNRKFADGPVICPCCEAECDEKLYHCPHCGIRLK